MKKRFLVTGGAGFIGSHVVDLLVRKGHEVVVFDNFDVQAHPEANIPSYLNNEAEFIKGDVRDKKQLETAIEGIDGIFHFAAAVGIGQSMYELKYYVETNSVGTANLLEVLVNKEHDVKKIVVAASMSSYGEGLYRCENCGLVEPPLREEGQLSVKKWDVFCPSCKQVLVPVATPETKKQSPNSIYALTKKDQEEMVLMIGKTYGIDAVALRFFNVYGPRQSLSNPYTGVTAIFLSRLKNNHAPVVFEDGLQSRDFVSVHDVAEANYAAFRSGSTNFQSFNVGSGAPITIKSVAEKTALFLGLNTGPEITLNYRKGDVRHCFADISKITSMTDWKPKISFEKGMKELIGWSRGKKAVDLFDESVNELKKRKLV